LKGGEQVRHEVLGAWIPLPVSVAPAVARMSEKLHVEVFQRPKISRWPVAGFSGLGHVEFFADIIEQWADQSALPADEFAG